MTVMTAEKNDGLISLRVYRTLDTIGLGRNLRDKVLITLDIRAAGSAELDKRELLLVVRKLVQKSFDSPEPLHDSLRVIDAIHADSKKQGFRSQLRQNVRSVLLRGNAQLAFIHRLRQSHADRMGPNQCDVVIPVHGKTVPLDPALQELIHRVQEIIAVRLNMETDQVSA